MASPVTIMQDKYLTLSEYKMKLEIHWRYKSIENLENNYWPSFDGDSRLIKRTKELRRKPLNKFEIEDLRIMISQNIGLEYVIPLALEQLEKNILAEGDYYKGDLLIAVVNSSPQFWERYAGL